VVYSGELVRVSKKGDKSKVIEKIEPRGVVGARSLIGEHPSPYIILASESSELVLFEKDDLLKLLDAHPVIAAKVYKGLLKNLLKNP